MRRNHPFSPCLGRVVTLASVTLFMTCAPILVPQVQSDVPRRKRGIEVSGPFLAFHGSADQMGNLEDVASSFRVIAVDADPADDKFSRNDIKVLRAGGRNIVLGILNVGFCDRTQTYWSSAPDGLLPCVSNLSAQIGERDGRPQQVWMDQGDDEYQRLIGEYVAPQIEKSGVDGFLLDGLELLDHGADDDEAPCDQDCVDGGLSLLAGLRAEFPKLVFVMQGGLSPNIMRARAKKAIGEHVEEIRVTSLVDGIVGEEVYTPSYNAGKEAALMAWKATGSKLAGHPIAIFTQDYVKTCGDLDWAKMVYRASSSHGFSPGIGLSPVSRGPACRWSGL